MRTRRYLTPFTLSFLDIMSCGFGAVVLLFLIIEHNTGINIPLSLDDPNPSSEFDLLNREIQEERAGLAALREAIVAVDRQISTLVGSSDRLSRQISESKHKTAVDIHDALTVGLREKLVNTERKVKQLRAEQAQTGQATRAFVGVDQREYISGLNLSGRRILILLDSSASMLGDTIVDIIRRRNMSNKVKRSSKKWRQAVRIVKWLSTRFPSDGQYQIYTFNIKTKAVNEGSDRTWLEVSDKQQLDATMNKLSTIIPSDGTNLENAFVAAADLHPLPDNIFLITDGLPTQGSTRSPKLTVTGEQRLEFFNQVLKKLPPGVPINTILSPMEGDPIAAPAFWRLAQLTRGAFLSPSEDWP